MKQPYGSTLPLSPTAGDVAFLDDGTLHFCYIDGTWTAVGGGVTQLRQSYDNVPLALAGATSTGRTSFEDLAQRKSPAIRAYTHYNRCHWDIWEFSSAGTLVNSWEGQQFSTQAAVYTFLAANAVSSGGIFTNNIVGLVYDIIDTSYPSITKMYGMNTLFSLLRGSRNYKKGTRVTALAADIAWGGFTSWFEDLCNQGIGLPAGYTWNAADNAERVLWFSRNLGRKMYGMPPAGYSSRVTAVKLRREWDWDTSTWGDVSVPNNYNNSGGKLGIWSSLAKPAYLTSWSFYDTPGSVGLVFGPNHSFIRLYRQALSGGNKNSVLVKPMGIDRVGLSWFDTSTYDLVAAYTKKNRTIQIRNIPTAGLGTTAAERLNDLIWLEAAAWWPPQWQGSRKMNFGATHQFPRIHFFLRDQTTGLISSPSEMRIQISTNMRDAPFKVEVQ